MGSVMDKIFDLVVWWYVFGYGLLAIYLFVFVFCIRRWAKQGNPVYLSISAAPLLAAIIVALMLWTGL